MPEHLIRLRGGWLRVDPDAPHDAPESGQRVTLPFNQADTPSGRVRLIRSFGPQPFDPGRGTLPVRFARVSGLVSARLNGPTIARPPAGTSTLEIPLAGPLPRRNLLVLDADFDKALTPPSPEPTLETWGEVALVISPREPSSASDSDPAVEAATGLRDNDQEELLGGIEPGA
jgi:hypothetical protein